MMALKEIHQQRILAGLGAVFLLLAGLLSLGNPSDPAYQQTERTDQKVFPRLARQTDGAQIIRITLSDLTYTLKRHPSRPEEWVMIESGDYPVRTDRLSELANGLVALTWGDKRTEDPDKFDRIGLGDPSTGGTGARIDVLDKDGRSLASLITGRKADKLYARFPDETKSFRANGDLPPLYTREAWLDLDIVDMQPDAIGAVRITEANGRSIYLTRPPGSGPRSFRPAPPFENDRLVSRIAASGPALALSRFDPVDAKPAAALETRPLVRHITSTHDGLEIDVSAYREPDGLYATIRAVEAGEGAARAATINDRSEGWAFRLAEIDWNDFTPSVRSIVRRAPPQPAAASTTP